MMDTYVKQVELLLRCLPHVEKETCFAVKGGTAINLFLLDMPRLSVDIDLVYLPLAPRDESLAGIVDALRRIKAAIEGGLSGARVDEIPNRDLDVARLVVHWMDVHIKLEPNAVIRGSVFPAEAADLCQRAQEKFELFTSCRVLSRADLYGGKICAALDRQHPRDLFDVKVLLDASGFSDDVRRAFIVYLVSHNRTMHELLAPSRKDIHPAYTSSFAGMMENPPTVAELEAARESLIQTIHQQFTDHEREFLLAFKRCEPKWPLLEVEGVDRLPAVQWKLLNLRRIDKAKHRAALDALERVLHSPRHYR